MPGDERFDLVAGRHEVGAAVARHHDRAGGASHARRALEAPAGEHACDQAAGKGITGTEHVQHRHRERGDVTGGLATPKDRRATLAPLQHQRGDATVEHPPDRLIQIIAATRRTHLLLGSDGQRRQARQRTHRRAECPGVIPLVGALVDVEDHLGTGGARLLGGQERGAAAGITADASAADEHHPAAAQRRGQHVIDRQRDVGTLLAVKGQRESVGRLNGENHRAAATPGLAGDVARLDALAPQKIEDERADLIVAHGGEQRSTQPEASCADGDVRRTSPDVGVETAHVGDRRTDLVRVQVDRTAPDTQHIEVLRVHQTPPAAPPGCGARYADPTARYW